METNQSLSRQKVEITPDIFTVSEILSPQECAEYIALSESIGYTAAPITTSRGFEMRPDIRNNDRVILDDPERSTFLWNRIAPHVPANIEGRDAIGINERLRFYRYDPGQQFAPHYDGSYRRPNGEESQLTFMIYLNEGFLGGETRFDLRYPYFDITVVPKTGMALCFVHHLRHEGAPVINGRKYVLRSDVMYSKVEIVYRKEGDLTRDC
ncbi:2OG-Fe(II) oxygenase [Planktothrix sp. FACHB-1355]|uniref:2OG-Fe(II) oxygenase n=1 Tax=Aerosakkonema funiforme FACHB-1375 TaxID=2949571 RepID=A0A926ZHR0_9CYAN|nr:MULTISPECIES: 2OG-Fe(II) oxygenase [Oscillatoriales]MBD2183335.1 2OG-Fe(II) oxygenase [Aerosakkonema funiforme FACHB-1375]MBD3558394.1 2OG-Fe(II) oxygenase [Planktothrix sp. FACHB-1355]